MLQPLVLSLSDCFLLIYSAESGSEGSSDGSDENNNHV